VEEEVTRKSPKVCNVVQRLLVKQTQKHEGGKKSLVNLPNPFKGEDDTAGVRTTAFYGNTPNNTPNNCK
jgi:hypothetical protein